MRTSNFRGTSWYPSQSNLQKDIFLVCVEKLCQVDIYGNNSIFVIFVEGTIHWILYFNISLLYEAATICILQTSFIRKMETFATMTISASEN